MRFYGELGNHPPPGFLGASSFAIGAVPWLGGDRPRYHGGRDFIGEQLSAAHAHILRKCEGYADHLSARSG
jgi:hypothetical protein